MGELLSLCGMSGELCHGHYDGRHQLHPRHSRTIRLQHGEAKSSGTFDAVIIGGGTFGLTLAQDLFERSRPSGTAIKPGNYRILVLEGGPFTLPEHVQDLPSMALGSPSPVQADPATLLDTPPAVRPIGPGNALPATRLELINAGLDKSAVFEN
jgi:hypothetical protein